MKSKLGFKNWLVLKRSQWLGTIPSNITGEESEIPSVLHQDIPYLPGILQHPVIVIEEDEGLPCTTLRKQRCNLLKLLLRIVMAVPAGPPVHAEVYHVSWKDPGCHLRQVHLHEHYPLLHPAAEGVVVQDSPSPELDCQLLPEGCLVQEGENSFLIRKAERELQQVVVHQRVQGPEELQEPVPDLPGLLFRRWRWVMSQWAFTHQRRVLPRRAHPAIWFGKRNR